MNTRKLGLRFNVYQRERFPFAVLIFTTLAVVLSSAAVAIPLGTRFSTLSLQIGVGTLTCLLFMFHIRVLDDAKDLAFDSQFHKDRPVQRGVISLRELYVLNGIGIGIQLILNALIFPAMVGYLLLAFLYSGLAKAEFFMGKKLKEKFLLYNLLNLMQLLFLQIYLYALMEPHFSFRNPLLTLHFVFVLANAAILEIARKLKSGKEESLGKDTYSSRYGINKASLLYLIAFGLTYLLFIYILVRVRFSMSMLVASFGTLLVMATSIAYYRLHQSRKSTKVVEGIAIAYYLALHLLIVGAAIL